MAAVALVVLSLTVGACATTGVSEKDRIRAITHYDIGVTTFGSGDSRGALRELLASVRLNPEMPQVHNAIAMVYHQLGELELAIEHYREATRLRPTFSEAHNNLGTALIDAGRYSEAASSFEVALGDILYRTPSLAEGNLGWARYLAGDVKTGVRHLRNAVATNPRFCRGYEWMMRIGLDEGDDHLVMSSYQRANKYCTGDKVLAQRLPESYRNAINYYYGLGQLRTGNADEARAAFGRCAQEGAIVDGLVPDHGFGAECARSLAALE